MVRRFSYYNFMHTRDKFNEICGNCGQRRGLHKGDDNHLGPHGLCPGRNVILDDKNCNWTDSPGTSFWGTGIYRPYENLEERRKKYAARSGNNETPMEPCKNS